MDNYFSVNHMLDTIVFDGNYIDFRLWLDSISDIDDRSMALRAIAMNRHKILELKITKDNLMMIASYIYDTIKYLQLIGEGKSEE